MVLCAGLARSPCCQKCRKGPASQLSALTRAILQPRHGSKTPRKLQHCSHHFTPTQPRTAIAYNPRTPQALAVMQGLFSFFLQSVNDRLVIKCRAGHFSFRPRLLMPILKSYFSCVRATPHIIHICIYIQYDIYINTIILSRERIKQYRHIDTMPLLQNTHTAKNNSVYDDFNCTHPTLKLEN